MTVTDLSFPVSYQYLDLGSKLRDYQEVWDYQRKVHAQVAAGAQCTQVLYVEHSAVYTAGRRTLDHERPFDGTAVIDVDRGGKITYHGPGQLVGYPIVRLPKNVGVVDYVRRIEEAIISYLAGLGIDSGRITDRTGVWLPAGNGRRERKICAIGIRVAKRTTMHGFALNVCSDLSRFHNIVPCGISDADVASIDTEISMPLTLVQVAKGLSPYLTQMLQFEPYIQSKNIR